jgi:predicted fused transcriptional regulator/phosphomethylpyrimidine kinase/predicted transcriptional regulator
MRPPCETVQRDFLPDLRMVVARKLSFLDFSQTEIAKRMELTQAAVSKYLSDTNAAALPDIVDEAASRIVELILAGAESDAVVEEVCSACMRSRIGGSICRTHKEKVESLREVDCQICVHLLGGRDDALSGRAAVLRDLQEGLGVLESIDGFGLVMPQVRANLVACGPRARSVDDVAGVPGRITMIDDKPRALLSPQFGASSHTSQLLLYGIARWTKVRACLCISGRDLVASAAEEVGFRVLRLRSPAVDANEIVSEIRGVRGPAKTASLPAVRIPGGIGVEPILYLFGSSATALAEKCSSIVKRLSV